MTTKLSPNECSEQLRLSKRRFKLGSRADSSAFRLAKAGRTMIRIRGIFAPQPGGGTVINYRIEFLPAALVALAVGFPLGLLVLIGLFWLARQSLWEIWPLIPISVLVVAANLWISERQAHWLVDFVGHQLNAT